MISKREKLLPKEDLIRYQYICSKLSSLVFTGKGPYTYYQGFKEGLNSVLLDDTSLKNPIEILLIINSIPTISKEDIEQQVFLFMLEYWQFKKDSMTQKITPKCRFSKEMKRSVSRLTGKWIGKQFLNYLNRYQKPETNFSLPDEPSLLRMDLSWVFLKKKEGIWSKFRTYQKYLIYLRYKKKLTFKEISEVTGYCKTSLDKQFQELEELLSDSRSELSRILS